MTDVVFLCLPSSSFLLKRNEACEKRAEFCSAGDEPQRKAIIASSIFYCQSLGDVCREVSKVCWLKPTGHALYVKSHNEDVEHQIADYEKRLGRRMEEERAKLLRLRPQGRVKTRVREMAEQIKCMKANAVLLPDVSAALPFVLSASDARTNGLPYRLCSSRSALIKEG